MTEKTKRWIKIGVVAIILIGIAIFVWQRHASKDKDNNIVSGNGRIEAVEIDIAAKTAGRIEDIIIREGDFVTAGQTVAKIDTAVLRSQLRAAEADLQQALSIVTQRKITLASAQRQNKRFQVLINVRLQMVLDKLDQKLREGFRTHINLSYLFSKSQSVILLPS